MLFTLEYAFEPWLRILQEFPRTFSSYKRNSESFSMQKIKDDQGYRDENVWGDAAQFFRGAVNVVKGVLHLGLSLLTLVPPFFALRAGIYYCMLGVTHEHKSDSVLEAVVEDLCFGFIRGLGLFLQGALQVATTPLLIFRIPIRLARTAGEEQEKVPTPEAPLSSTGKTVTASLQLNRSSDGLVEDLSESGASPSPAEPFGTSDNQRKALWTHEEKVACPQNTTFFSKEIPISTLPGELSAKEIFDFLKDSYKNKDIEDNTFLIWFGAEIPDSGDKNYLDNIFKHKRNNLETNVTLVVSRKLMKEEYYEKLFNTCQSNKINLVDFDKDLEHLPNYDLVKKFIYSEAIPKPYNYVLASDILRFSLIYEFGGRYFDTDISSKENFSSKRCLPLGLKLIEGAKPNSIEMDAFMGHKGHFLFLLFMTAARYYGECAFDFLAKKPICRFISTIDPNIELDNYYNSYILVKEEEIEIHLFEESFSDSEDIYLGYGNKYILFKNDKKLVYVEPNTLKPKVFLLTDAEVAQIESALVKLDYSFKLNLKNLGTLNPHAIGYRLSYVDDTGMLTHVNVENFEDFLGRVDNLQNPEYQDKESGAYNIFYDQAKKFIFPHVDHRPITLKRNIGQFVAQTTGYSMVAFSDLLVKLNELIQADDEECVILPYRKRTYDHVRDTTANSPSLNKAEQTIIDTIGKEKLEFMMNKAKEYGFGKQSSVPIKQQPF